ncbi:ATP-dependent nuclease [Salipiger mangrovisoli]|uniref:ATP-binding protein n=1 Tax=Salipiger mangrovisoli TaxID=2865933 RepID=A0ABR9XC55_9RHOB|nr:ATP-binding protein [Salipiger mangrovisoli]MBE9640967.1 ATP-binding protein [Salipiger mangrovisoli]
MSKVKSVVLQDYKSFSRFTLSAREKNILVGPNNAGKSTTLDAFRIAFDVLRYASRKTAFLKSQGDDGVCSTWEVPISIVQIDLRHCIHNFGDGRARISIQLDNGNTFVLLISNEYPVECYLKSDVQPRRKAEFLREQFPLKLAIVPTLSPLEQNEELVRRETVERNKYGRLASRNFRNFWLHKSRTDFETFADLIELGWPGIRIQPPEIERTGGKPIVRMYFRDGPHVREIQWAGFGFQVWMQTMMHLLDAGHSSTLILDEPDIYLHPDLQHRLLRLVSQRVGQYFIATHSTEIINDVEPGEVLIIRPETRGAKRIQGESDYSDVYSAIGSSENAQFARLARTKKVLYFEGKDAKILSKMARKTLGMDFISNSSVTLMKTDGFSNWSRVTTSSWVFENFFGFEVPVSAVFDRDYRSDSEVQEFLEEVNSAETLCRVLPCKEIENLLIAPNSIERAVRKHSRVPLAAGWEAEIRCIIDASMEATKLQTLSKRIGQRAEFELSKNPKKNISSISTEEEKSFSLFWDDIDFRKRVVPGKIVFSNICREIQDKYKFSLTAARVIDEMTIQDIPSELREILNDIKEHLDK